MGLGVFPLVLVLLMLGTAVWLWRRSQNLWQQSGLPDGNVIYSDTGAWFPNTQPLYAPNFGLSGKPDYLVQQADGSVVPVELKSGRAPDEPWEGHILQLAAYCLLVEECYGREAPYGIIKYDDRTFEVDYTPELEQRLLGVLEAMELESLGPDKVRATLYNSISSIVPNCATICIFPGWSKSDLAEMIQAATGFDVTVFELFKVGERALNLARVFNMREGLNIDDDRLAERSYGPTIGGALADGGIGWRKWPVRRQGSFDHWLFDDTGGVQGLVQRCPEILRCDWIRVGDGPR